MVKELASENTSGKKANQTPMFIVPKANSQAADNPVCFKITPPPSPETPFVSEDPFKLIIL